MVVEPTMPEVEARAGWLAARKAWLASGPNTLARINSLYKGDFIDCEPDPRRGSRLRLHEPERFDDDSDEVESGGD